MMGQKVSSRRKTRKNFKSENQPVAKILKTEIVCNGKFYLTHIHLELLEIILLKAAVFLYRILLKSALHPEPQVYQTLTSLSGAVRYAVISRRWFKHQFDLEVCRPYRRCLKRLARLSTGGANVIGVAHFENKIYVVCDSNSWIDVFLANPKWCSTNQRIITSNSSIFDDIIFSPVSTCLYASDHIEHCIWKITREHNVSKLVENVGDVGWPGKLSVTTDGRLLLSGGRPPSLDIYNSDGSHMQNIVLPQNIAFLRQAVETSTKTFIVYHGHSRLEDTQRVCEISPEDGKVLRSYWDKRDVLRGPGQLAFVSLAGFIIVSDCGLYGNGRIIMLDSTLHLHRILLDCHEVNSTGLSVMNYAPDRDWILVGHKIDGSIDVYSLRQDARN